MNMDQKPVLTNVEPGQNPEPYSVQLAVKKEKSHHRLSGSGLSWLLIILVLVLLAFAVNIFRQPVNSGSTNNGGNSPESTSYIKQPRVYTISYRNGVFSPTNLRIHAGDTVRFKNESIFSVKIVGDDLVGFDSVGDVPQGSFFAFTFAAKGIFGYHNEKSSDESGTIIVR